MLKLFISYAHKDETLVSKFLSHIAPLRSNGIITEWIDRKLEAGEGFQEGIDNNLEDADVICLMISANFLASKACLQEKDAALALRTTKGIRVIPVILSPCAWTEHLELKPLLASPTDGKPITTFANQDEGWLDVIKWLKGVCISVTNIKNLKNTERFASFLRNADLLSKSHNTRETLILQDIFVFPKLKYYDQEDKAQNYNADNLNHEILKHQKLIIAGDSQSGKTTLCKMLFLIYRKLNYVPIYLEDANEYLGNPFIKLEKAFSEQYQSDAFKEIDTRRIVPIVDNFHTAKHYEKYIEQYEVFRNQVLIVDDIFGLSLRNQATIKEYHKFKIREFSALERNEIITKWIKINEEEKIRLNPNHLQQSIDEKTELIEHSLGKIFGKGIMPSYPFFILSVLAAQDTQTPLDSEITSQGHCYQALIYLYLRKQGVKNEQIDIYTNFLTEVSFAIFEKKGKSLDGADFELFLNEYKDKFNLPIPIGEIIQTLAKVNICKFDSLNEYNFSYSYIYYFFVAKYLAEHIDSKKKVIEFILSNLHENENAYITVFIAHHTKSDYILDELLLNAEILFEKHAPASLNKEELSFFDEHEDKVVKAILPSFNHNSSEERKKLLLQKAEIEEKEENLPIESEPEAQSTEEEEIEEFTNNLRLSFKTVEVMGLIIKNRSGSLNKKRLEDIFEQGLKVHLRILTSFIEVIKDANTEKEVIKFLLERINQVVLEKAEENKELGIDKIEKLARGFYWNLNFGLLHGFTTKAIHSLGSSNLLNISQAVCDNLNTPVAFIVNQGIRMWYAKNLKIDEIGTRMNKGDFSKTAKNLIKLKVVEHCTLHQIAFRDLQKIEKQLQIPSKRMLAERAMTQQQQQP